VSSEGIPKYELIILGVSLILAFIVFFTSKFEKPPVYHILFAVLGAIMGIAWVYALTNEIVEVMKAIGLIFNLSDIILGLTVLSWGNSLGGLQSF
jgi:sodium/potassium/calcium exchanger 6